MKPFEVPITSDAATLRHVGRPKLRFPASEKTCPVIFLSLVHLTTSHGAPGTSGSGCVVNILLDTEDWRDREDRNAGEETILGDPNGEGDSRDENRLSKGCREVERWNLKELCEAGTLLPGEDNTEPFRG